MSNLDAHGGADPDMLINGPLEIKLTTTTKQLDNKQLFYAHLRAAKRYKIIISMTKFIVSKHFIFSRDFWNNPRENSRGGFLFPLSERVGTRWVMVYSSLIKHCYYPA
jgi:hypothetical protein